MSTRSLPPNRGASGSPGPSGSGFTENNAPSELFWTHCWKKAHGVRNQTAVTFCDCYQMIETPRQGNNWLCLLNVFCHFLNVTTIFYFSDRDCFRILPPTKLRTIVRKHGLRTPGKEIAFTARPKIHSHSKIFIKHGLRTDEGLKAYVSEEILNWHSLSDETIIIFLWLACLACLA